MDRLWIAFAALAGAAGAFGDAAVRHMVADPMRVELGVVAARYGLVHAVALLAVALLWRRRDGGPTFWLAAAAWCFIGGQLLFSGSLYLLAAGLAPWSGLATKPGLAVLLAGWVALFLHAVLPRR